MFLNNTSIFAYAIGLLLVFVLCRIFIKPLKWVFKLGLSGVFGGLILAAINFAGGFAGISVTVSPLAALIAGTLGFPGVVLVIALQYLI